jgi:hypothetical protein
MFIPTLLILLFFTYLLAYRYFRFRRFKSILHKYNNVQLDYHKAQEILLVSGTFDMPYIIGLSLSFALFKTYGIPTVSRLLVQTNQLAQLDVAGRRAEDTGVLTSW